MKIESSDHAPAISKSLQLSNNSKSSEKPFAHLLVVSGHAQARTGEAVAGVVAPQSERQQWGNVFGFGELGVFGRYGAHRDHESSVSACKDNVERVLPPDSFENPGKPAALVTDDHRSIAAADGRNALRPDVSPSPVTPAQVVAKGAAGDAASAISLTEKDVLRAEPIEDTCADDLATPADSKPAEPQEDGTSASPVSISVSGEDYALNIIARSEGEQGGSSELRRQIENTAAEFGLQVHEIHLNGSTSQSFRSFLGGNSGSRIR